MSFTCSHDSVNVKIVPAVGNGTFQGEIYVKDNALTEECALKEMDEVQGGKNAVKHFESLLEMLIGLHW